MCSRRFLLFVGAAFLCLFVSIGAAAAPRVFVATHGNDANPCTSLSPCRSITHGLAVVDTMGEVIISESGDYDNVVIGKSVTIAAAPGIYAGITANTQDGIDIIRLSIADVVTLRNLTIKGTAANPGIAGINNNSAGYLYIDGCYISGVTQGIFDSAPGKMSVHNTTVRNCQVGVYIFSSAGFISNVTVDSSIVERNNIGVAVGPNSRTTISNCSLLANSGSGVRVSSELSGIEAEANIQTSVFHANNVAVNVFGNSGGTGVARLSKNTISKNLTGVNIPATGTVYSTQDNLIVSNDVDLAGALTPLAYN